MSPSIQAVPLEMRVRLPRTPRELAGRDLSAAPFDFSGACEYALTRLAHDLDGHLRYHAVGHTRDQVAPSAARLGRAERVRGEPLLLLLTAAYFHDIGFVEQYMDNEPIGVRIALETLPRYGYRPDQLGLIRGMILATRIPQDPQTLLEQILADADLDALGRRDLFRFSEALRQERAAWGFPQDDVEWYRGQIAFLEAHRYFTPAAQRLRAAGKARNLARMRRLLEQAEAQRASRGRIQDGL